MASDWHDDGIAPAVEPPIRTKWLSAGGAARWQPLQLPHRHGIVATQQFIDVAKGMLSTICSNGEHSAWFVTGAIRNRWYQMQADRGVLGTPAEDTPGGNAHLQHFTGGCIATHPEYGTFAIYGAVYRFWQSAGAEHSIGFPETDVLLCQTNRGSFAQFVGPRGRSRIYVLEGVAPLLIRDPFFNAWFEAGAEWGELGFPCDVEADGPTTGSRQVQFERGHMILQSDGQIETHAAPLAWTIR